MKISDNLITCKFLRNNIERMVVSSSELAALGCMTMIMRERNANGFIVPT